MRKSIITAALAAIIALSICGCGSGQTVTNETENAAENVAENAAENAAETDGLYQVALLQSLTLGNYDGLVSVGELKEHGDIGIGTFEGVNGEMIVLDGTVYQALYDGSVVEASDEETVPYATVAFMDDDIEADISAGDLDELKTGLDELVEENGVNQFYFVRINCTCANVYVRSELKQEKPYKTLDEALATDQREFSYDDAEGTIVGLYCPDYMSGLNTAGWHFHFISEDRQTGGHLLSLTDLEGKTQMDLISDFEFCCPNTEEFNEMELGQDQSDRIQSVEQ